MFTESVIRVSSKADLAEILVRYMRFASAAPVFRAFFASLPRKLLVRAWRPIGRMMRFDSCVDEPTQSRPGATTESATEAAPAAIPDAVATSASNARCELESAANQVRGLLDLLMMRASFPEHCYPCEAVVAGMMEAQTTTMARLNTAADAVVKLYVSPVIDVEDEFNNAFAQVEGLMDLLISRIGARDNIAGAPNEKTIHGIYELVFSARDRLDAVVKRADDALVKQLGIVPIVPALAA